MGEDKQEEEIFKMKLQPRREKVGGKDKARKNHRERARGTDTEPKLKDTQNGIGVQCECTDQLDETGGSRKDDDGFSP